MISSFWTVCVTHYPYAIAYDLKYGFKNKEEAIKKLFSKNY